MGFTKFLNESKWNQLKLSDVEVDDQYQKFFKSTKLNEVYYVYVDKNNMNINKNFYTVLIK